jgi:glycosyltransferase involved in cell wall biosynthesis
VKISIVIPAHNEADYIGKTLESLVQQTLIPHEIVVVNDNSADTTAEIINEFRRNHKWIKAVDKSSSGGHLPGAKIISAFNTGLEELSDDYDLICKFDADLVFPKDYLEKIAHHYLQNPSLGMASGFCYIKKEGAWVLENLTNKDHIRGALKCYRKKCFEDIGGLKPAMGWDTIDELLALYHNWEIQTDVSLKVRHLKPTGHSYNKAAKLLQGEAMYRMRYGLVLTLISGLKLAYRKKNLSLFWDYLKGYRSAQSKAIDFLVTEKQGEFIRKIRWQGIRKKLF